jgi:hypothetical protein
LKEDVVWGVRGFVSRGFALVDPWKAEAELMEDAVTPRKIACEWPQRVVVTFESIAACAPFRRRQKNARAAKRGQILDSPTTAQRRGHTVYVADSRRN